MAQRAQEDELNVEMSVLHWASGLNLMDRVENRVIRENESHRITSEMQKRLRWYGVP